jgi:hypothetical protein
MNAQVQSVQGLVDQQAQLSAVERAALLAEVDFKWLMAGQGWWVDTARFHRDPAYAAQFLLSALASPCMALRNCARGLQALAGEGSNKDIVSAG